MGCELKWSKVTLTSSTEATQGYLSRASARATPPATTACRRSPPAPITRSGSSPPPAPASAPRRPRPLGTANQPKMDEATVRSRSRLAGKARAAARPAPRLRRGFHLCASDDNLGHVHAADVIDSIALLPFP